MGKSQEVTMVVIYVSVCLAIADTTIGPAYWEVNAAFSICLFNQITGNYRYVIGRTRRFQPMKMEWGFSEFISKKDLTDPSNGYLTDDNCVFGVEVFVNTNKTVIESLSLKTVSTNPYKREFNIQNFSTLTGIWTSDEFTAGDCKWNIQLYPNGNGEETGRSASIFLGHVVSDNSRKRVKASYTIAIKNQVSHENYVKNTSSNWFVASGNRNNWGWSSFIKIASLTDPKGGFIVNDCCLLEIELSVEAIAT